MKNAVKAGLVAVVATVALGGAAINAGAAPATDQPGAQVVPVLDWWRAQRGETVTLPAGHPIEVEGYDYIECGTCGAHVHEWWYTTADDGELIPICGRCADAIDAMEG